MKRNFLLTALLACFALGSSAQVSFGPMLGLNLANASMKFSDVDVDTKMKTGFHIGGVVNIGITEHFSVMPGLLFSAKGAEIDGFDMKYSFNYLEIPVNALYMTGEEGSGRFMINAGPYLGYCIGGKAKGGGGDESLKVGSSDEDNIKPMDFGLNVGVGYMLPMGLFARAQYGFGFANTATGDDEAKNRVIGISVGYLFGGK